MSNQEVPPSISTLPPPPQTIIIQQKKSTLGRNVLLLFIIAIVGIATVSLIGANANAKPGDIHAGPSGLPNTATTSAPATIPTPAPTSTKLSSSCQGAVDRMTGALDGVLDRVDNDLDGALADDDIMSDLDSDAFAEDLATSCGYSNIDGGVSAVIVWLADQVETRPAFSAMVAQGGLEGICEVDYESITLTPEAKAACA